MGKRTEGIEGRFSIHYRLSGKIAESAQNLYDVLKLQDQLSERLGKLFTYAHMRYDEDTTNSKYQALNEKAENLLTAASSSMSFIVPEILAMDDAKVKSFLEEKKN